MGGSLEKFLSWDKKCVEEVLIRVPCEFEPDRGTYLEVTVVFRRGCPKSTWDFRVFRTLRTIDFLECWALIGQKFLLPTSSIGSSEHVQTNFECLSGRHVTEKMRFFALTTIFFDKIFRNFKLSIFATSFKKITIIFLNSPSASCSRKTKFRVDKIFFWPQKSFECWSFFEKSTKRPKIYNSLIIIGFIQYSTRCFLIPTNQVKSTDHVIIKKMVLSGRQVKKMRFFVVKFYFCMSVYE